MDKSIEYLIPFLIVILCIEILYFIQRRKGFTFASLIVLVASLLGATISLALDNQSGSPYFFIWFVGLTTYGVIFLTINLLLVKANKSFLPHTVFFGISLFLSPFWFFLPLLVSCMTGYDCI